MLSQELEKRLNDLPKDTFLGSNGFYTKALFRDHPQASADAPESNVFFIAKEYSTDKYISLKEVYMAMADPTEYSFAIKVFGSYRHWLHIADLSWAKDHVAEWRHELQMKLKSQAIKDITRMAEDDEFIKETTRFQALKYLANSDYAEKTTATKKKKSERSDAIKAGVLKEVSEDFERLGITPIRSKRG